MDHSKNRSKSKRVGVGQLLFWLGQLKALLQPAVFLAWDNWDNWDNHF